MGEHLVVRKATFVNGLLQIELKLVIPEKLKPQKIKIEDDKSILFG
jgi:HSP20 family molecular chaperone IbpA